MSPEKYITWSDLPNYDDYGDEQYWWGNYDSNGDYVELSIGIDWNDPHPFFGVWVDGMLMTDVEVFDMDRVEEYRQKALEQLSIIVFEKEHNMKFPRDYWDRPILGSRKNADVRIPQDWFVDIDDEDYIKSRYRKLNSMTSVANEDIFAAEDGLSFTQVVRLYADFPYDDMDSVVPTIGWMSIGAVSVEEAKKMRDALDVAIEYASHLKACFY